VDDIVSAYLYLAAAFDHPYSIDHKFVDRKGLKVYGVSSGDALSVMQVVDTIMRVIGESNLRPIIEARASDETSEIRIDGSLFQTRVGWKPKVSFDMGIAETALWLKKYLQLRRKII
jgi:nucleoside-diphosphate-sugar epimerase